MDGMDFSLDILERNAWDADDQSEISELVTANDNFEAAWRNEEGSPGQPASAGDEAQAPTCASDDQMVCEECETRPAVWYCKKCGTYCDECWLHPGPHKRKSPLHQLVSCKDLFTRLQSCTRTHWRSKLFERVLDPDLSNLDTLHRDDDDSLWFSVDGDTGSLELREFPRFGAIMSEHQRQHSPQAPPYPRLVSFISKNGEGMVP
ncbi:hypothetical protein DER44DRAFT_742040 [Fusarium oxysporum]|nr:hypothetical protein DER44DRAFT_742040 [Fusarium oxysporum]